MTADESMANQAASGPFVSPQCWEGDCDDCGDSLCACECHRPDEESE